VTIYDIDVPAMDGTTRPLADYRGKALLIVNVASRCGFTPQYEGLEALYRRFRDRGLVVLAFPCNQFRGQEPEAEPQILAFCQSHYGVTFPVFAKIDVNGPDAHPLYRYLTAAQPGVLGTKRIKWNFTKFLVDAAGTVVARYAPTVTPAEIEKDITPAVLPRA
jgi:glutathione peroxidase